MKIQNLLWYKQLNISTLPAYERIENIVIDYSEKIGVTVGYDQAMGENALANALANVREIWEPETTARNLALIRESRLNRGIIIEWANEAEKALLRRAGKS